MSKLFGNTGGAHAAGRSHASPAPRRAAAPAPSDRAEAPVRSKKRGRGGKVLCILLAVLVAGYCLFAFVPIAPFRTLRNMYIETALSTMRHQWLATAFFPKSIVESVRQEMRDAQQSQNGVNSGWGQSSDGSFTPPTIPEEDDPTLNAGDPAMEAFFQLFWELDREETRAWLDENPAYLESGWAHLTADASGLDEDGLPIHTTQGEQVLAIDAENGVLLLRVTGTGYRGVLAVAKDPSRLTLQPSASLGTMGQNAGDIAEAHNGLLAMTASGFIDEGGHGKGGTVTGYALCDGTAYGTHFGSGYKRLELRKNDLLYLTDATAAVSDDATDAMEFTPALIVDGKTVVDSSCGWTAINPRASLGQSDRGEILMLVIEGRLTTSLGTDVMECAAILARHNCMQAMNMDGGTSAILWYNGRYVTRCSNTALPAGRLLPNAWVYGKK